MSSRRDRLLPIVAVLYGAMAGAARADDGIALLELLIDGRPTERIERFVMRDGWPQASLAEWRALGLRVPEPGAADGGERVSVTALPGVRARVDLRAQTLALDQAPDPAALSVIGAQPAPLPGLSDDLGALLNYDLAVQHDRIRTVSAGLLEARLFGPLGVFDHSQIVTDATRAHVVRLDTTFTHSDPERMRRLRVGDFVNVGLGWTRPVRLAGVQAMTDFALRPDLVTAPLPALAGNAAVPSTVEVLVNGVRQLSQPVEAGRFEVRQMPVVSGLGEVSVVVRDALGRESVQTLPFYASMRQLAHGLSAYALELGRVRRGYGSASNDYGDWALSATLRYGIDDALTFETHAEATPGAALAGAGGVLNLGPFGVASGTIGASRGGATSGRLANLGFERQTETLSVNLSLTRASAGYRDIAAAQGDAVPRRSARLGAGLNLGTAGSLGVAIVDAQSGAASASAPDTRTRIASATYGLSLASIGAQLFLTGYRDLMPSGGHGISLSLAFPFGTRAGAAAAVTRDRTGSGASLLASQSAITMGDVGWRLQADERLSGAAPTRQLAQLEYLAPAARVNAEVEHGAAAVAARLGLQGSLLAFGGRVHATLPVTDSVAVVGVDGHAGVAVYHENRFVGRTDEAGQIVVPGLLSFHTNHFAIDPLDLPLDVDIGTLTREVRPADRSGVLVRFPVERSRSALVVLQDASGAALPLGARASLRGNPAEPAVVGHDGQVWLSGLGERNELAVRWGGGRGAASGCVARFAFAALDARGGPLGPVQCE